MRLAQEQLARSFAARALSIRAVTSNSGRNTPGIDNVVWDTPLKLHKAIQKLSEISPANYKPSPVKRIYIPKPNGEKRPLGIPTMIDRSYQTLWNFAILPIAESTADSRSYGFRPYRSTKDAVGYTALLLKSPTMSRRFVLEGDIVKFFDTVSHDWLIDNIPMNKVVLRKILTAGYVEYGGTVTKTDKGFAQGGTISPTLANMSLNGLQDFLEGLDFRMARYADDFVVLGRTSESLEEVAKPKLSEFLEKRGLTLHPTKSVVTNALQGFNFLGFTLRLFENPMMKSGYQFHMYPQYSKVIAFCDKLKAVIKKHINNRGTPDFEALISELNPMLRGWSNYYRSSKASLIFKKVGKFVFETVWRRLVRFNPEVSKRVLARKYFKRVGNRGWLLYFTPKNRRVLEVFLYQIGDTPSVPHVLIKGEAHPSDETHDAYLANRAAKTASLNKTVPELKRALAREQLGLCLVCNTPLLDESIKTSWYTYESEKVEIHHIKSVKEGGTSGFKDLILLHRTCHAQVTHSSDPKLIAAWKKLNLISS